MSKNRQQASNIALETARKNREKAVAAGGKKPNKILYPDFVKNTEVVDRDEVEVVDSDVTTTTAQDMAAEVENIPDHIEEEQVKQAVSQVVDINAVKEQLSTTGRVVLLTVLQFMEDTAPGKPLEMKEGAKHISRFWTALKTMFNSVNDHDFPILFRTILDLMHEHRHGVFADEMVYRFAEEWPMTEADQAAYKRLITMMIVTRNAATRRQSLKQLKNWEYTLKYGLSPKARTRIENFYDL